MIDNKQLNDEKTKQVNGGAVIKDASDKTDEELKKKTSKDK